MPHSNIEVEIVRAISRRSLLRAGGSRLDGEREYKLQLAAYDEKSNYNDSSQLSNGACFGL
jgi:hypothetical protein